jgi:hypothetical protein
MKVIMEFNLPEEQEELENAQNGYKWATAAKEFDQALRNTIKYEPADFKGDINTLQNIRDKFNEILSSYNLRVY